MKFTESKTNDLINEINNKDPYSNSSLRSFKSLSSKRKGKFFEELCQEYYENLQQVVDKPENTQHDRIISGLKKEIKGSFLWGEGTHFRWQQIRVDDDYDQVIFMAAYPDRIELYEADKDIVKKKLCVQDADGNWPYNQHGGKTKNSGTFFIDGFPQDFDWMRKVGQIDC